MGKREKKIETIKKYITNIASNYPTYSYGKIPSNKARNACNSYGGSIQPSDVLGLIDTSLSEDGSQGLLFTEHAVYYKRKALFGLGDSGKVLYKNVSETGTIPSALFDYPYNKQALNDLVSLLSKIDSETVLGKIDGAINTGNEILDAVDKAKILWDRLFGESDTTSKNTK